MGGKRQVKDYSKVQTTHVFVNSGRVYVGNLADAGLTADNFTPMAKHLICEMILNGGKQQS